MRSSKSASTTHAGSRERGRDDEGAHPAARLQGRVHRRPSPAAGGQGVDTFQAFILPCLERAQNITKRLYVFLACTAARSSLCCSKCWAQNLGPCLASPPEAEAALRGSCQVRAARTCISDGVGVSVKTSNTAMQVDFLPAAAMSEEDLERQRQVAAELAKRTRWVDFEYDGQPSQVGLRSAPRSHCTTWLPC